MLLCVCLFVFCRFAGLNKLCPREDRCRKEDAAVSSSPSPKKKDGSLCVVPLLPIILLSMLILPHILHIPLDPCTPSLCLNTGIIVCAMLIVLTGLLVLFQFVLSIIPSMFHTVFVWTETLLRVLLALPPPPSGCVCC